jgi:hypothetical protein
VIGIGFQEDVATDLSLERWLVATTGNGGVRGEEHSWQGCRHGLGHGDKRAELAQKQEFLIDMRNKRWKMGPER